MHTRHLHRDGVRVGFATTDGARPGSSEVLLLPGWQLIDRHLWDAQDRCPNSSARPGDDLRRARQRNLRAAQPARGVRPY
jgi:hypothetical protein